MTWRLNKLADLHWRCWGDDWALFDGGAGNADLSNRQLRAVTYNQSGAVDLAHLLDTVALELMLPNDPLLSTAVKANLEKLTNAGLIESSEA